MARSDQNQEQAIEYAGRLAHIEEKCDGMDSKLNMLCRAVLGNSDTEHSLVARVNKHGTYLKILGVVIVGIPGAIGVIIALLRLFQ